MKVTTAACKALFAVLSTATALAAAQSYPNKPVRFLGGFVAGGTNDIVARALNLPDLRERLTSHGADPIHRTPEGVYGCRAERNREVGEGHQRGWHQRRVRPAMTLIFPGHTRSPRGEK